MENLKITVECLRDLAAFHNERVAGYQALTECLAGEEQYLATLFNAFIAQSNAMGEELRQIGESWGWNGKQLHDAGKYGLAWSVVKAVFASNMPCYPVDKCRSGENALLIAYHSIEGTDGLAEPVRLLINRQKREVIAARDWITHFETVHIPQPQHARSMAIF